ncbi:MAG: Clp protease ClpP [Anaerotignum sp.]|nr:Clp protease ClpP [Anaerotignum sp.]
MRKNMWEIKQAIEGTLDLYIYGDVEGDSYDWWTDEIIRSETSANTFRETLAQYPNAKEIKIYINSYGGSVFEGTAIYNQLKRHSAKKTVYIDGFACSIASVIAMAADEVVMPRNALMMIHNAWMGACGNAAELRKAADDLDVINNAGKQAYLQKAGEKIDSEELSAMMDAETWLTAEDCIKYGLADRFADADADMTNATTVLQKANLNVKQRIDLQKSLVAQLRQLAEPSNGEVESDPVSETDPEQKTEPENEPNLMQMLGGFFITQKESGK